MALRSTSPMFTCDYRDSWWAARGRLQRAGVWEVHWTTMPSEVHYPLVPHHPLPGSSPNPALSVFNVLHRRKWWSHWPLGTSSAQHLGSPRWRKMGWGWKWELGNCALRGQSGYQHADNSKRFRIIVRKGTWRLLVVPECYPQTHSSCLSHKITHFVPMCVKVFVFCKPGWSP